MKRKRSFGLAPDTTVGGSDYDIIAAAPLSGVIPEPTEWWPVNSVAFAKNKTDNTHENQVRGFRGQAPPEPFKARPAVTVEVDAYFEIVARAIRWCMGLPHVRTGVAPAAFTDRLEPIPYASSAQPSARHLQFERDELTYRVAGAQINTWALNLPFDDDGVLTTEWMGLFYQQRPSSEVQDTPDFGDLAATTMKLRDVSVFIDGSLTKVPDVQAARFNFGNGLDPKEYAGRNRVPDPANPCQKVWFPAENKLGSDQEVGYGLTLGNTSEAEEFKQDFSRAEKLVFEIEECPIATVPAAVRLMRHTIAAAVHTGGGAENLTRADDITSPFEGSGYHSDADGYDIRSEFVHNTATLFDD